ncbi:hypothetical protein [Methylobacterium nonmethylotrophicum]|uniref:hypothetical protein n=1 Tax=Methylobacterium nonmethylotrophicum TaxID=1141884 RepID=UPI001436895A|nr:hypothetical protein [Methylobacterium nonmethylotrophicum]
MCHTCFLRDRAEFGAAEITPAVVEAARLSYDANPCGPLHIMVDDYGVEDTSIAFCALRVGERWAEADRACLAAFQTLRGRMDGLAERCTSAFAGRGTRRSRT